MRRRTRMPKRRASEATPLMVGVENVTISIILTISTARGRRVQALMVQVLVDCYTERQGSGPHFTPTPGFRPECRHALATHTFAFAKPSPRTTEPASGFHVRRTLDHTRARLATRPDDR